MPVRFSLLLCPFLSNPHLHPQAGKGYTITLSLWSVLIAIFVFAAGAFFVTNFFGENYAPAPAVDTRVGRLPCESHLRQSVS